MVVSSLGRSLFFLRSPGDSNLKSGLKIIVPRPIKQEFRVEVTVNAHGKRKINKRFYEAP